MNGHTGIPTGFTLRGEKITGYLLNPHHPRGGSKARFFLLFGFAADRTTEFADALLAHVIDREAVVTIKHDEHRGKLICEGPLRCPDGRRPMVRTIWLVVAGDEARFITAVPLTRTKPGAR